MKQCLALVLLIQTCFSQINTNINTNLIFKKTKKVDKTKDVQSCLMDHTFYHPESKTCEEPLDDYSCPRGQWMVPDKNRLGEVRCEDVQENKGRFQIEKSKNVMEFSI